MKNFKVNIGQFLVLLTFWVFGLFFVFNAVLILKRVWHVYISEVTKKGFVSILLNQTGFSINIPLWQEVLVSVIIIFVVLWEMKTKWKEVL